MKERKNERTKEQKNERTKERKNDRTKDRMKKKVVRKTGGAKLRTPN